MVKTVKERNINITPIMLAMRNSQTYDGLNKYANTLSSLLIKLSNDNESKNDSKR